MGRRSSPTVGVVAARHSTCFTIARVHEMRSFAKTLAAVAGKAGSAGRSLRRRLVPLMLVMILGLGSAGPCLCDSQPLQGAADPHACCKHAAAGRAASSPTLQVCLHTCPGSHTNLAVAAASIDDHHSAVPVAVVAFDDLSARPEPALPMALSAPHHSPPARKTVLRI